MKKLIIFCFLVIGFFVNAQQPNPPQQQTIGNLQGLKIAYVTKELKLSSDEAQKFWPVYYSFIDDLRQARQKNKLDEVASDEAALAVKKKYQIEFKKILGSDERANKVFLVERNFAAEVKKELEKRMQRKMQNR